MAVTGKRLWLVLWTVFVLLGHLLFDAHTLYQEALSQKSGGYQLNSRRLTDRVVLVVLDSWAERVLADGRYMPKLFARQSSGAHGVLWAPRQTATINGILSLSTGRSPSGLAAIGLMSYARFEGWTIFDDVAARGENVSFHGGPVWLPLFGDRGAGHFRETGHGPNFREEDMAGLRHSQQALLSGQPPALSVVHITETDVVAHHYGTERPEYAAALQFWDEALDDYLQKVLARPGTTVIVTADHGNDANGAHGGSETIYRRVPVIFLGQGIAREPRIEMNAADMPATIAALLGVRAPDSAVALPAVQALQLSAVERGRVLMTAYFQSLINRAALKARPEWMAMARGPLPADLDEARIGGLSEPQLAAMLPGVMSAFHELEGSMDMARMMSGVDWAFVAATFVLAAMMLWSVAPPTRAVRPPNWPGVAAMACTVLLVEALFGVRIVHADALKGLLHGGRGTLMLLAGCAAVIGLLIGVVAWRARERLLGVARDHIFLLVVLVYLLASILYPVNTMGMMVAMLLAAWLWQSPLSSTTRWYVMGAGLAALVVSTKVWVLLGESLLPRMAVGTALAVLGAGLMAWASRRMGMKPGYWPAVMGLALVLSPFSGFNVLNLTKPSQLVFATGLVGVLAAWAWWRSGARDSWLVWPLLPPLWFWWWGVSQAWGLYVALALGCTLACLAGTARAEQGRTALHARLLAAALGMLLTLSAPMHVPSLLGFLLVIMAFFQWRPMGAQRWPAVAMAAVLLVAARYALFDVYGYADSPVQVYVLKHLDLGAAYLGDDSRAILGAVLMVVLKIWLAGAVLMLTAALFPGWRGWLDDVMAVGGVLVLIMVGQAAVRAGLAFDDRAHQYDAAAFSMLVHTGMLILSLLAYAPLRWLLQLVPPGDPVAGRNQAPRVSIS